MFLIAELVDRAKARADIESDYRLAKVLGITQASVSTWRTGKSLPNEKVIQQLAALSGDDPDLIAAQVQAERSKDPVARSLWLRVTARMSGAASTAILSLCLAIGLIAAPADSARAGAVPEAQSQRLDFIYIVSSAIFSVHYFLLVRLRRYRPLFRASLSFIAF